jgi:Predicted membrane protein (DUF2306)
MSTAAPLPVSRRMFIASGFAVLSTVALGQLAFAIYVFAAYGSTALKGELAAWSRLSATGWVVGDARGNAAMAVHVLLAVLVLGAGAIQLLPVVRRRAPLLHRWSGRAYLSGCAVAALTGLALVWGRGTVGDLSQHLAISVNAGLLLVCLTMTWRTARARRFAEHRVWATRTYLVAAGVYFFRIFLALWLVVHRAPVGFDPRTFSGPFLTTLAVAVYVVGPLAVYEVYRWGELRRDVVMYSLVGGASVLVALLCLAGTASAGMLLWWPKLHALQ